MSFYETLTAAINDFTEYGYDSPERLAYWQERLKRAAEESLMSQQTIQDMLVRAYRALYDKMVTREQILRFHRGVGRFTLEKVRPQLRSELDRRILASADLIKLNRESAVQKTLQRFSGWATSIPQGGSDVVEKSDTKSEIRKSLTKLPFEERRVLIDQGHKLRSNLNATLAQGGGAIAAVWESHWRQTGYHYRPDHKARDGKIYLIRNSWAQTKGLVKPGAAGYTDDITEPAEEPFCFPAESEIPFADFVEGAFRREFTGELTTIVTEHGSRLDATPNHPILTIDGWRAVGSLNVGDYVIEMGSDSVHTKRNNDDGKTTISEIFGTIQEFGRGHSLKGVANQFHGDGSDSDVNTVWADRPLSFGRESTLQESIKDFLLLVSSVPRAAAGALDLCLDSICHSFANATSSLSQQPAFSFASPGHTDQISFGSGSQRQSEHFDMSDYDIARNAHDLRYLQNTLPFVVKHSKIISVNRREFSGHVYNLQTRDGWYVANNILAHNCRCNYKYLYGLRQLPKDMITQKGLEEMERIKKETGQ